MVQDESWKNNDDLRYPRHRSDSSPTGYHREQQNNRLCTGRIGVTISSAYSFDPTKWFTVGRAVAFGKVWHKTKDKKWAKEEHAAILTDIPVKDELQAEREATEMKKLKTTMKAKRQVSLNENKCGIPVRGPPRGAPATS
ncbi:hypothetical protein AVEN_134938-1 [Araneus ventricosus]|uniref:Uncharacterized protein n=1 Tax=Araneus ventricosus TaxID=182803 RepID=A0A4Y2CIH9_ARAVE|nr:hypothetical protein AVEN_134938-1 [Araneus ventricosus]